MTLRYATFRPVLFVLALVVFLTACAAPDTGAAEPTAPTDAAPAPATDPVAPTDPAIAKRIAITPPAGVDRYPVLAEAVAAAIAAHQTAFGEQAAEALADGLAIDHWQLRIDYRGLVGNRYLRLVQGEGHVHTGGAHGMPIIERYTWNGYDDQVMAIGDWFQDDAVWTVLADYVRQALLARGDDMIPAEMVEAGTAPEPDNFALYEPVFSGDGPVMAFNIIFPPYQVAPYAAGPQSVEVPLAVLDPYLGDHARTVLLAMAGSE